MYEKGDKVYSKALGYGVVERTVDSDTYPIVCKFGTEQIYYTKSGINKPSTKDITLVNTKWRR